MIGTAGAAWGRFADGILAAVVLAIADIALFHVGLYFPLLALDSYAGRVEETHRRLGIAMALFPGLKRIVFMGDSTVAETIDERLIETQLAVQGVTAYPFSAAEGGAGPRSWNVLLLNAPFTTDTVTAVVVGIFPGGVGRRLDVSPDIEISKSRLCMSDAFWFAASYKDLEKQLGVFCGAFFRTTLFRRDILDALREPRKRLKQVKHRRNRESELWNGWRRHNEAVRALPGPGVYVNGRLRKRHLPPWLREDAATRTYLLGRFRELGLERRWGQPLFVADSGYLRLLERLIRRLNGRGLPVVLAVLPNSPYPSACRDTRDVHALAERLASRGAAVTIYEDDPLLDHLEAPGYYKDQLHLNGNGARLYSEALASFLAQHVGRDHL